MQLIIKFLQIMGFWVQPYQKRSLVKPLLYISLFMVSMVLPGIIFIVRQPPSFTIAVRTVVETISIVNIIILVLSTVTHQQWLEEAYIDLRFGFQARLRDSDFELREKIAELGSSVDRYFKIYIKFQLGVVLTYISSNPIFTLTQYLRTGELPPLHAILEADFYLFDFTGNVWLWLLVIAFSAVALIIVVIVMVPINSLNWSLIKHAADLFKLVSRKAASLNELTDEKSRVEGLIDIVELHEVIYRSVRSLEKALNIYMLTQFGSFVIMVCLTLITLILVNDDRDLLLKMILTLSFILSHILMYSMLGTALMSASASVSDAIYDVPWYQWSVSGQKNLLFVLRRSQRITALTTGKFFYINRATFGMALRTAGSYFTVLMQMYGAQ
ncbi:odorant receptor 49b-like [Armigeres subalbatus]|uniref:odorant receptor 49b-like n=1 Tax=Armigeres subalbatus TaxID=124917 RepID=UPI002ED65B8C